MLFGNGFMTTVTNIGTFHDHFAHYVKVDVWCSWCSYSLGEVAVAGVVSVVGVVAVVGGVCVVGVVSVVGVVYVVGSWYSMCSWCTFV